MSRTQAIDNALFMPKHNPERNFAPASNATNRRLPSLSSHTSTATDYLKAWEPIPIHLGSRLASHSIAFECSYGPNKNDKNADIEPRSRDKSRVRARRPFANRTRIGCGTCRKRKKKCDEAKPTCNNCIRGNFDCTGYSNELPWWRNNAAKAAGGLRPQEGTSSAKIPAHSVGLDLRDIVHIDLRQPNQEPIVERKAPSALGVSPDMIVNADERGRKPRCESCTKLQQHASKHRPLLPPRYSPPANALSTAAASHAQYAQSVPQPPANGRLPNESQHPTRLLPSIASLITAPSTSSLSHYTEPFLPPKSEKHKMLSGNAFLPDTAQLVDERDLSSQASFRFNTAVKKASEERLWLFERVVAAEWIFPRAGERQVTGRLGHGINVSAPFHCEYGYNLSIGDNATIGPGCQLLDSGRIAIGRNTEISARVTISTLEEPTGTRPREASERTETVRDIYIGENVYIGDGCIIKAGACIGDNAIVRAGAVVIKDIPANCVASGNPARAQ